MFTCCEVCPTRANDASKQCPVCLEEKQRVDMRYRWCGHFNCEECYFRTMHSPCPMCRAPFAAPKPQEQLFDISSQLDAREMQSERLRAQTRELRAQTGEWRAQLMQSVFTRDWLTLAAQINNRLVAMEAEVAMEADPRRVVENANTTSTSHNEYHPAHFDDEFPRL